MRVEIKQTLHSLYVENMCHTKHNSNTNIIFARELKKKKKNVISRVNRSALTKRVNILFSNSVIYLTSENGPECQSNRKRGILR